MSEEKAVYRTEREIRFRGKTPGKIGRWVEGSLIRSGFYCCILEDEDKAHPIEFPYLDPDLGVIDGQATRIDPKTIGQYTGLKDKNRVKVFDGDIVKTEFGRLCVVTWFSSPCHCGWDLEAIRTCKNLVHTKPPLAPHLYNDYNLEVVGNIFDNPELLEED